MSRLILFLAVLSVSSCSLLDPFIDRRREAGVKDLKDLYVGESKPDRPVVCYNSWTTDYAEVKKLADDECRRQKTGNYAEPVDQSIFSCRLLIPTRLYFECRQ